MVRDDRGKQLVTKLQRGRARFKSVRLAGTKTGGEIVFLTSSMGAGVVADDVKLMRAAGGDGGSAVVIA